MIKHMVMWKFRPEIAEVDKAGMKDAMAEHFAQLIGKVPGLLKVTFVKEPIPSSTHDMALLTDHDSREALAMYAGHPDHVQVADTYVRPYVEQRCCLDYENQVC